MSANLFRAPSINPALSPDEDVEEGPRVSRAGCRSRPRRAARSHLRPVIGAMTGGFATRPGPAAIGAAGTSGRCALSQPDLAT